MMKRFTVYRTTLSQHPSSGDHYEHNQDNEAQFEGVIFSDGQVVLRWLTPSASTSVWSNIHEALSVHGHPEYGTLIEWHDGEPPESWIDQLYQHEQVTHMDPKGKQHD